MLLGIYDDLLLGGVAGSAISGGYKLIISGYPANPAAAPVIASTRDLANWTAAAAPWVGSVISVAQGNELMLAVGGAPDGGHPNGFMRWARSKDYGASWAEIPNPGYGLDASIANSFLTFGRGLFVGCGETLGSGPGLDGGLATSPDGLTWTQRTIPWRGPAQVGFVNGLFVMVGYDQAAVSPAFATSVDGISWAKRPTIWGTMQAPATGVSFENGLWILTRAGNDGGGYAYSTDLANWTLGAAPNSGVGSLNQIVYFKGNYYASSHTTATNASGAPIITGRTLAVSADLKTWRTLATGLPGVGPIALLNVDGARMMLLNHETNGLFFVTGGGFSYTQPGPLTSYYVTTDMQSFTTLSVPGSYWQAMLVGQLGRW